MDTYTIYDTNSFRAINGEALATKAAKYLIDNTDSIYPIEKYSEFAKNTLIDTPVNILFKKLLHSDLLRHTTTVCFQKKTSGIPELLAYTSIPIDIKVLPAASAFQSRSYLNNKTVINITPYVRRDRGTNAIIPVDLNNIHDSFVRSSILQSYHDFHETSSIWMTIPLSTYIIKSFSTVVSSVIAKFYMLNMSEQVSISYPLALFMAKALTSEEGTAERLFYNCTYLGTQSTLQQYLADFNNQHGTKDTKYISTETLCELLREVGPDRMSTFNMDVYIRLLRTIGNDIITSLLAIECPAFWVHMLLSTMSNNKMRLYFELRNNKLLEEAKKFTHNFIHISNYTDKINR